MVKYACYLIYEEGRIRHDSLWLAIDKMFKLFTI